VYARVRGSEIVCVDVCMCVRVGAGEGERWRKGGREREREARGRAAPRAFEPEKLLCGHCCEWCGMSSWGVGCKVCVVDAENLRMSFEAHQAVGSASRRRPHMAPAATLAFRYLHKPAKEISESKRDI
jgi:hypothetical protein